MKLDEFERNILECPLEKSEAVFQKAADSYEDELLEYDDFPEPYFLFFLKLLSEQKFFDKPGLWNFLLVISTESHKLSSEHYSRIADAILNNYVFYEDEDLCLAVCDFVARNYDHNTARGILDKLREIENEKSEKGFADDGLRILANEIQRETDA